MDSHRTAKDEAILTSVAESIGAALGTIAAKAGSVQKVLTDKVAGAKTEVRRAAKTVGKKKVRARAGLTRKTRRSTRRASRSRRKKS